MSTVQVVIDRLGDFGDGVADRPGAEGAHVGAPIFVPSALPGETWSIDAAMENGGADAATPVALRDDRRAPRCAHHAACGGCRAQHMPTEIYTAWKTHRVSSALSQAGVTLRDGRAVAPLLTYGYGHRRRIVVTARAAQSAVTLGYHARASSDLVDITMCPIAEPVLEAALPTLRALAAELLPSRGAEGAPPPRPAKGARASKSGPCELRIAALAASNGLDVAITGVMADPDPNCRARLSELAEANGIARLVVGGRDVVRFAPPTLLTGTDNEIAIVPPSGSFAQASARAEADMIARVSALVGASTARKTVDLFAGIGTFTLELARSSSVTAVDSDADALAALTAAANAAIGLKPITTVHRDLFRDPLAPKELDAFDALVFDPPRAGSREQAERIAKSSVPTVVAVSCNPQTFARDAALLIAGGYTLEHVQPIDQFAFSEHVESVAHFSKPKPRKGGRRRRR
ncbi:MAG: hypothetical protein AAFR55_03450 [Pseudomonadota bacterium]